MDDAPVVREMRTLVGELTEDEAALVRTLTPADLAGAAKVDHLLDLVDLLSTIRSDEAMAEYVYAIAPSVGRHHRDPAPGGTGHHRVRAPHSSAACRPRLTGRSQRCAVAVAAITADAGSVDRSAAGSVEQADAGEPEARCVHLGRRGQVELVAPQACQRVLAGPLHDAR